MSEIVVVVAFWFSKIYLMLVFILSALIFVYGLLETLVTRKDWIRSGLMLWFLGFLAIYSFRTAIDIPWWPPRMSTEIMKTYERAVDGEERALFEPAPGWSRESWRRVRDRIEGRTWSGVLR